MNCKISLKILIVFSTCLIAISCHKIYFIGHDKLNWDQANRNCKTKGMNLASIKTKEEQQYLRQYISETYGQDTAYWLGAYNKNGQFVWSATGEKINTSFWHAGEPNGRNGKENCVHTWWPAFDWNDNDCENEGPFICDLEV